MKETKARKWSSTAWEVTAEVSGGSAALFVRPPPDGGLWSVTISEDTVRGNSQVNALNRHGELEQFFRAIALARNYIV